MSAHDAERANDDIDRLAYGYTDAAQHPVVACRLDGQLVVKNRHNPESPEITLNPGSVAFVVRPLQDFKQD